ncbi:G5 domain-containing protein [Corynebacterium afermentans]|uniref:G5 domain-containing protein n=1 Tax=Corynebacterium afermentans TaxID=38286 RepID=UPI0025722A4B|nr:G5 domain-containing protein [Corynebacterium afermentans]MCG7292682.1 G5 domain-containing protein [Corynebacterium afermentans]
MAESSRRFRKSTSRSIAASSAIALALGGISIVGPGPLAPHAAADTLSGGIRDESGAVEEGDQQASDLPAGSCVVKSGEKSGSQAGFSWNTLEPNAASPDKKAWGLSVSFDSSKDRTFTDWYFSNSGKLKDFLDAGQVPSMEAGQTFIGKDVTHKAGEIVEIGASGRDLRTLNVYAELTDEKVKQFASASAGNPVRYAWQSNYKKDNPEGAYATQGGSAIFGATVNPWPSENIECNPISVSWESAEVSEKHVIVPGEETKVGTINVPALQNGGTDDSLSRMVVEAYDGNGEFIGTTDPDASGGEQLLRVDEATGDIYFTWPEYRGTVQATDKNVNFSVLAKPRSVNQLQAATEHNNDGNGEAFDSSNSLDRYSKANVIDSKAFSLDDTEYHDPKYDKTDASIISGVDSATGPLATEPQKVTFTQVPDLIKDLEKKKGDGGFEAKVSLDEKYVYDGWTVEMDEDYNVTVTAPKEPKPGTFARPVVTVEYSNGSTDELELLVVVDPNNTQVTDLVRPSLTKGTIGDDLTAQVGTKSIMKGHKPVHPAKFEVDPSTVPDGWTVTVDETGKVTATPDDTVAPGTIITPTVKATYPDETTDEIETQFQAIVNIKVPDYDTETNKPGTNVSLPPTLPERGLSGNTTDEAPKHYTFEDGKTEMTVSDDSGTWTVKIDENTGEITTTIPKTAPEGYILNVPVLAYYDNADKPQQVKGTVVVLKGDIAPVYSVESTGPSKPVDHQIQDAPKGSTYSFGKDENDEPITEMETVDGWKYTIDPDTGVVSSTPPADSKPGDKKTISVTVDTPDGSSPKVPVTTVVNLANNWEADPTYPEETVYPGGTAKLPVELQIPEDVNVAKESPYKLGTIPDGWTATIDDNGQITATAPADAEPGTQVEIPVTVTYEDGSTDTAKAVVNVVDVPTRELPFDVEYKFDDTIPAGEYKVETEGAPGEEKQNKDGTWEQTTAPTNEVVVIGTKPAESSKDVTWTFPIPYPTEVRENPDLAPGETKVVQEGENGEKTYTAKFTAKGDQAQVAEDETNKDPVKRIVEYGPRLDAQELETKTDKPIPFTTKVVFDDTLAEGEQVVDQPGELGNEVSTSTQKLVDGKPSGDPTVTTERTKEPTEQIIRVGTKNTGKNTESVESEIPFDVKVEFDPNMPAGTSETVTEGKPGKKTVTIKRDVTNSTPGEPTISEEVTEDPVDQVIKVGTKPSEASEKVTWTAQVPFEVETRPNPELKPGEIKVAQKGVPGEKTYSADFSAEGDQATVTPEEKQTKDPVKEIIEYGPAAEGTSVVTKLEKPVPFETEIVFDDTLAVGEQVVDQQGELGAEVVTSTQKLVDGNPSGEPTETTEQTKAPKKAIIRVGTKQVEPEEPAPAPSPSVEPLTVELPYPVEYVFDPNLPAGEKVVDQEGTPGAKTLRPKLEMVDGKPVWTIEEVETQKPVQRVVRVGTKQPETNPFTWTSEVPFNTTVKPNPELAPGESRVVQVGENGSTKYSADPATGEVTKLEEKKPVERIVEYGPKDDVAVTKVTRPVPFETEVIYDPDLPEGAQRIEQGEVGEEVVTTTQDFKDGQLVGEPTTNTERTREPKNAVVRIGTKKTPKNASVTELEVPPTTQLIFDPSLAPGEQVVVREGTPGTVRVTTVDDETTVENTLDAIPRLVRVGAKQPDQLNWLEPLPFKVIATENPNLPAGEHKVIQEGKPGLVQHVGDTATTVTEPQDYILEIGTAKDVQEKREVITEPIPFETIVEEDDTLAAGVVKVVTQGENGAKRTTKVWEMKEGKELGDPTVTDETLREPTNLVIRVGTGKPVEEKPEDPKPEQPKPDTPVEDEKGSSAERCVANAFAANSPLLWLLPVGLLGAIGYGVNEMYGPQINQASGALNARWEAFVRENTPDFGHGHRGIEKPEWVRQAEAQANALNQQFNQRFAGYGEQLRPVGIALGALAAVALTGTLIAQACSEEGFDNGMTVLGSTERKLDFGASSEKADGAKAGSSSRESGSSKKNALTTAAKPTGEK